MAHRSIPGTPALGRYMMRQVRGTGMRPREPGEGRGGGGPYADFSAVLPKRGWEYDPTRIRGSDYNNQQTIGHIWGGLYGFARGAGSYYRNDPSNNNFVSAFFAGFAEGLGPPPRSRIPYAKRIPMARLVPGAKLVKNKRKRPPGPPGPGGSPAPSGGSPGGPLPKIPLAESTGPGTYPTRERHAPNPSVSLAGSSKMPSGYDLKPLPSMPKGWTKLGSKPRPPANTKFDLNPWGHHPPMQGPGWPNTLKRVPADHPSRNLTQISLADPASVPTSPTVLHRVRGRGTMIPMRQGRTMVPPYPPATQLASNRPAEAAQYSSPVPTESSSMASQSVISAAIKNEQAKPSDSQIAAGFVSSNGSQAKESRRPTEASQVHETNAPEPGQRAPSASAGLIADRAFMRFPF